MSLKAQVNTMERNEKKGGGGGAPTMCQGLMK